MARHMFFGGNTPDGFYSCFGNILFPDEARKIIYLKGSSGGGKSTLMRKVGKIFEDKGYLVDYIHCSNNVADLDGICIRDLGISLIDGTAPHICDPLMPGAIDEIFNSGDFIDKSYVEKRAKELLKLQAEKRPYYEKAYRYLKAAYEIYLNNSHMRKQALDTVKLERAIEKESEFLREKEIAEKPGRFRKMFSGAITPQGNVNYIDTLIKGLDIIVLKGNDGMGTDIFLEKIKDMAISRGYYVEGLFCSLNVEKLDHLILPELNICYTTVNDYHATSLTKEREIDFYEFVDSAFLNEYKDEMAYNSKMASELMERAMNMMAGQKVIHDNIESIYIKSMDFDGLNRASESITDRLLKLIPDEECEV